MMPSLKLNETIDCWGFPVCVFENPIHEKYKNSLLEEEKIGKHEYGGDNTLTSIESDIQFIRRESESVSSLREVFSSCLNYFYNNVIETQFIDGSNWEYLRSWCITFNKSYHDHTKQHFHGHWMSFVTVVYYLNYPSGSGALTFKNNQRQDHVFFQMDHKGISDTKTISPSEGNILVFPSCLLHAVEESTPEAYTQRCTIVADTAPSIIQPKTDHLAMNAIHIERVPLTHINP